MSQDIILQIKLNALKLDERLNIEVDGVPLEQGGISGNSSNFLSMINPSDIESRDWNTVPSGNSVADSCNGLYWDVPSSAILP